MVLKPWDWNGCDAIQKHVVKCITRRHKISEQGDQGVYIGDVEHLSQICRNHTIFIDLGLLIYIGSETVTIVTLDGRIFIGELKGFDQKTNVILANTKERIFSEKGATQEQLVGLFLLRGEAIATVGLSAQDHEIDFSQYQAAPLRPIHH